MKVTLQLFTERDVPVLERLIRAYHAFEGIGCPDDDIPATVRPLLGHVQALHLECARNNARARRLYEALGLSRVILFSSCLPLFSGVPGCKVTKNKSQQSATSGSLLKVKRVY